MTQFSGSHTARSKGCPCYMSNTVVRGAGEGGEGSRCSRDIFHSLSSSEKLPELEPSLPVVPRRACNGEDSCHRGMEVTYDQDDNFH